MFRMARITQTKNTTLPGNTIMIAECISVFVLSFFFGFFYCCDLLENLVSVYAVCTPMHTPKSKPTQLGIVHNTHVYTTGE